MTSHTMRKLTCMVCLALVGMSAVQATSDVYSRRLLQVSDGQYKQGEDVCIPGAATESVLDRISNDPQFSTLNTIIEKFGLGSILSDTSNKVTLFAPTDSAWAAAFADNVENTALTYSKLKSLLNEFSNDANGRQLMSEIIKYHVLPKVVAFDDLVNKEALTTLWDQDTLVVNKESGYTELAGDLSGAVITRKNIWLCNGVVHIIDTVLLPQAAEDTFNKVDGNNRRKLNQDGLECAFDFLVPLGKRPCKEQRRKLNQAGDTDADDEALESSMTQFMNSASKFLGQLSDSLDSDDTDSDNRRKLNQDDTDADDEALESSMTQFMNTYSNFLGQLSDSLDSDDTDSDNRRKLNQVGDTDADDEALDSSVAQFLNTYSNFLGQISDSLDSDDTDYDNRRKLNQDETEEDRIFEEHDPYYPGSQAWSHRQYCFGSVLKVGCK